MRFHAVRQNTEAEGWKRLLDLVDVAVHDERPSFNVFAKMDRELCAQVVTLPPSIARLRAVTHLRLYNSFLVRIPPEIGEMENLSSFDAYASTRLHWLPYEIKRCRDLDWSRVSVPSYYGNWRFRPPFPELPVPPDELAAIQDADVVPRRSWALNCTVCKTYFQSADGVQAWITDCVGTEPLPLLVNACSRACLNKLPLGCDGVRFAHQGGPNLIQRGMDR